MIDLQKDRPIVTYCSGIGCSLSMDAAAKLTAMGYTNVRYLLGGISEWELKGYPIVRDKVDVKPAGPGIFEGGDVAPPLVNENLTKVFILDTRPQPEFDAGHLPNAWNVPLERLTESMGEISGEVIVCDRQPKRWKRAVSILKDAGYDAHGLSGGVGAWVGSGLTLVTGLK
jgi:rhodanese-related sulfurtransferase